MPERQPFIAGNWKMHKTLAEARALARDIRQGAAPGRRAEVALGPPFTALAAVAAELAGSDLRLAAQDTFWEKQGAYTGAISPGMLADVGCHYVIVGHSERRQHFGDTDAIVNKKLTAVVAAGLTPILCVGETIGGAPGGPDPPGGARANSKKAWGRSNRLPAMPWSSLTSRYGPSARGLLPPRIRPRRCTTSSAACSGSSWGRWPKPSAFSTAAASPRTTPPPSWPSRTSTAPWWAARRSNPSCFCRLSKPRGRGVSRTVPPELLAHPESLKRLVGRASVPAATKSSWHVKRTLRKTFQDNTLETSERY